LKCLKGKELGPMLSSSVQHVRDHVQGPVGNIECGSYRRGHKKLQEDPLMFEQNTFTDEG
jgi:hypothetical protein